MGCCCTGCREMGAEPAILGLHREDVILSWDLEAVASSIQADTLANQQATWPLVPLSLFPKQAH